MPKLTLRRDKKAPLTAEDLDNNFQALLDAIEALSKPSGAPMKLHQHGHRIELVGPFEDQTFGTAKLWNARGLWIENRTYEPYDVVQSANTLQLCLKTHTSESEFQPEFWIQIFAFAAPEHAPAGLVPSHETPDDVKNPKPGQIYFNSDSNMMYIWNKGMWKTLTPTRIPVAQEALQNGSHKDGDLYYHSSKKLLFIYMNQGWRVAFAGVEQ